MSNLQKFMGGMALPTQNIPQLRSTGFISRNLHKYKLADLADIATLENKIAEQNVGKLRSTLDAMTLMATFGERIKAEMEGVELNQRHLRAMVRQEEAKARIGENEAKKEEFDFLEFVKRDQNET